MQTERKPVERRRQLRSVKTYERRLDEPVAPRGVEPDTARLVQGMLVGLGLSLVFFWLPSVIIMYMVLSA